MSDNMEKEAVNKAAEEFVEVMPLVDIVDGSDGVTMWFEVPGANNRSVDIEVRDGVMAMKAVSSLCRNGKPLVFKRRFQLADGVDVEKITAKTEDGVLILTIPKSEDAKVHRIKVR